MSIRSSYGEDGYMANKSDFAIVPPRADMYLSIHRVEQVVVRMPLAMKCELLFPTKAYIVRHLIAMI